MILWTGEGHATVTATGPRERSRWASYLGGASHPGAWLRHSVWRAVWGLVAGGLRVSGPRPQGPAVVVAGHASHADTAALLAAIPASARPVFAAAEDYWFDVPWRRRLVTTVVSALPVRRHDAGAYAALREAATPVLARGGIVVLYPEGTRSTDGELGRFRSGAVRLARDCGVPVVPVALLGTDEVLPKKGRFSPAGAEVRFGEAIAASDLAEVDGTGLRQRVADLGVPPRRPAPVSRTWRAVASRVNTGTGLLAAALWGLAEALSWPVTAEMFLVLFAVAVPRRVLRCAVALAAGSVVGVLVHAWLTVRGITVPMPFTTSAMREAAATDLSGGPWGVWHQALSGVPVKVYAAEAGRAGVDLVSFALATAAERLGRSLAVGLVLAGASRLLHPVLQRHYVGYLAIACATYLVALAAIVHGWS